MVGVQAEAMVASGYYETAVDVDQESARLRPRVHGYFFGTYHPSHALEPRAMFVAEQGSGVIGFVAGHLSTRMGCDAELQWIFVRPAAQGRGVGSSLLPPIAEWFTSQGATHVIIDAPPENPYRTFYIEHGAVPLDSYWLHWRDVSGLVDGGEPPARDLEPRRRS